MAISLVTFAVNGYRFNWLCGLISDPLWSTHIIFVLASFYMLMILSNWEIVGVLPSGIGGLILTGFLLFTLVWILLGAFVWKCRRTHKDSDD